MKNGKATLSWALGIAMILSTAACTVRDATMENAAAEPTAAAAAEAGTAAADELAAGTDQAAADDVAARIDAIYVQRRTDETDAQCAAAKAGWDALSETQRALVAGEYADPDYFGRDTGDASLDDPLNGDGIGENELLVVSFGTSFNDSRTADIGGIEKALQAANPDWSVRRAFTAQIILNHIQARDGEAIDNMEQALERAVSSGVKNLVVQPTHLMHGAEYDELVATVEEYRSQFARVTISEPLLGEAGTDFSSVNADKERVAKALTAAAVADAGYDSLEAAAAGGTAFVFMGHGTSHRASVTYSQMQEQMGKLGYGNVFIGTVEGEPEATACSAVIDAAHAAGFTKIVLRPLMVVAGDHANNDMAGDDADSWKSLFAASGYFASVDAQITGLGRLPEIQAVYAAHAAAAMPAQADASKQRDAAAISGTGLADGVYRAVFTTDSAMFRVNEAMDGRGVLTVTDGKASMHISLGSKKIVNLFCGSAEEARQAGAQWLAPTTDTVTYSDKTTEEVHGFDIPVPVLGAEFAVALVGTKGVWYDHMVCVSDPVALDE